MGKGKDTMLTVREAAARIGASESSIRVWAWRGKFPGARKESTPMGEYWLIPEKDVEAFEMGAPGRPPKPKAKKGGKKKPSAN